MNFKYPQSVFSRLCYWSLLAGTALFFQSCSNKTMQENSAMADIGSLPPDKKIQLVDNPAEKRVNVLIDGLPFTSLIYPDDMQKPVLYPILTAKGTAVTRGFPLDPRPGERVDHPHHVGLWFNYGDVNGLDFWNNSYAIPEKDRDKYGTIVEKEIAETESGDETGTLVVNSNWNDAKGKILLKEQTTFVFSAPDADTRIIDRVARLTAQKDEVLFKDNKEGMIGMRLARELEHPSDEPAVFTDAQGNPTEVTSMDNKGISGVYHSSEGVEGEAVWGTQARWVNLTGEVDGEKINLIMMDHPENVGFPTYWHARGYGLFAANPLGRSIFSGGKEQLNFILSPNESTTFRYRIIVHSGENLSNEKIEELYNSFAKDYNTVN